MNLSINTLLLLLVYSFIQGLAGLRLTKVVIPAYKLRGESAFLECQYELNGPDGSSISSISYRANNNLNNDDITNTKNIYRRSRNHQHQRNYHQQQQQQQQQQHQQQYETQPSSSYRIYDHDIDEPSRLRDHHNLFDSLEQSDEGEALYAVKWYKDNEEFYRYVPKANPTKQSYRVDGIRVIEEHSDSSRVLLRGLTLNSTGLYRCEVSAEAPNFSSVQGEGRMDIVYLPRDGPYIRGNQGQYQIGDMLNLNCSSGKSHPASHLQWLINDEPLMHSSSLMRYNDTVHRHGLITSTLGLQLPVDVRHFENGKMRVKCLASISPVLWKGGRESVLQKRPGVIDNREAMLLVTSASRKASFSISLITITLLTYKICQLLLFQEIDIR